MPDTGKPKNRLVRFFSNPLVGGLGTAISLIGILLAFYFYLDQKEFRNLTYIVHPVKVAIVKTGQASKLTAMYADKPIKTDITAVQVALWNQGKLPIKNSNILSPIVLYTANKSPILEATIRKVSREVIKLQLQTQEPSNGLITISWQILEQYDAGIIQLIYAGNTDVDIRLSGVIEGQKEIERVEFPSTIQSPDEQYAKYIKSTNFLMLVAITVLFIIMCIFIFFTRMSTIWPRLKYFVLAVTITYVGMSIYFWVTSKPIPICAF